MLDRIYVFDGFAGWDPEVRQMRCSHCQAHCANFQATIFSAAHFSVPFEGQAHMPQLVGGAW